MIKIKILNIVGFEEAIHGMRNPMNSWNKSDSASEITGFCIGKNDLNLMKSLFKAGSEHRKYDRMIQVYMDITAPLYWWKEFDTYKIGTVTNSCSTMHKIHAKEFNLDDFSHEHLLDDGFITHNDYGYLSPMDCLKEHIQTLNMFREKYLETKDKTWWWQMIQLLPSSYNQKRTVMMNYEVCARIIEQRQNHKLDEWLQFADVLKKLPYMKDIAGKEE